VSVLATQGPAQPPKWLERKQSPSQWSLGVHKNKEPRPSLNHHLPRAERAERAEIVEQPRSCQDRTPGLKAQKRRRWSSSARKHHQSSSRAAWRGWHFGYPFGAAAAAATGPLDSRSSFYHDDTSYTASTGFRTSDLLTSGATSRPVTPLPPWFRPSGIRLCTRCSASILQSRCSANLSRSGSRAGERG
jgi:hypothetical protein